ncbi:MAG: GNAT family N-acetyltransferase [Candidatus Xenobia bacterium]
MKLRTYEPTDAPAVMSVWNAAMPQAFPMDIRLFRQNTEQSVHYRVGDAVVAVEGDRVVGYGSSRVVREPLGNSGLQPEKGWISALVVHPEAQRRGVGSRLLSALRTHLEGRQIGLGGDPAHFLPGLPTACDDRFWLKHGFQIGPARAWDLKRSLDDWVAPERLSEVEAKAGVSIAPCREEQVPALHAFFAESFPGRWHHDVTQRLKREGAQDVLVVGDGSRILGFSSTFHSGSVVLGPSVYWQREGGLGPIGVSEALRGRGLGLALVWRSMEHVKSHGANAMGIDWTVLLDFYGRAGFAPWLEYRLSGPR